MEHQNQKFCEFTFDAVSYSFAVDVYVKKITENNVHSNHSKENIEQLDLSILEKLEKCSQITENRKTIQADNFEMQTCIYKLKEDEEELTRNNVDLKEALKDVCKTTFIENNEQFRSLAQKIQINLGFKLKLTQCHDNPNLWTAKFLFDAYETDDNQFVLISYYANIATFGLCDMNPKPSRFTALAEFLSKTNDINGLLYNCWKFFSKINSPHK